MLLVLSQRTDTLLVKRKEFYSFPSRFQFLSLGLEAFPAVFVTTALHSLMMSPYPKKKKKRNNSLEFCDSTNSYSKGRICVTLQQVCTWLPMNDFPW